MNEIQQRLRKLKQAEQQNEELRFRLEVLIAQAKDCCGVIEEYVALPCKSLEDKFPTATLRLRSKISNTERYLNEIKK